jgi:hypothetical protein
MAKQTYHKLDKAQKEEIRRLTQLANRRIAAARKEFGVNGISPSAITGGIQLKEDWFSEKYAISRSIKFENEAAYREQLKFLQSFDPKAKGYTRPSLSEWAEVERNKTVAAVESVLGVDSLAEAFPDPVDENGNSLLDGKKKPVLGLYSKIMKMRARDMDAFWRVFSDKAKKVGPKYNSNAIMMDTLAEFFPEDIKAFNNQVSENIMVEQYKRDMEQKQ